LIATTNETQSDSSANTFDPYEHDALQQNSLTHSFAKNMDGAIVSTWHQWRIYPKFYKLYRIVLCVLFCSKI